MFELIKRLFLLIFSPHFLAGLKAEEIFEKQALENSWIVEKIPQDQATFGKYKIGNKPVKRGDYICRNCDNAEVEVKCKKQYGANGSKYYLLEYSHIKRHQEMQNITNSNIVFAFYQRNGADVFQDTLRMVDLGFLLQANDYKSGKLYDKRIKCIKVPLKYTRPNFEVLGILKSRSPNKN